MYENETFDVILQRMLDNISDDIDKREGSVAWDMLAPKAIELSKAYIELDNVLNFGFAETTYGQYLDLKVSEVGMSRLTAIKAKGSIQFSGTDGITIPYNTVVSTESGIDFVTDADVKIASGIAVVTITAVVGGLEGNVPANSIVTNPIDNVTCFNSVPTTGGTDTESDDQLLKRYLENLKAPAASGNASHYRQWSREVSGIGDAKVIPIWNGANTVKVILVGQDRKPVIASKVTEVANYIETNRPIGATVTVESAAQLTVNIVATLSLSPGYTITSVKPVLTAKLTDYLKSIAFVETSVKYSKIGMLLLDTDGVLDYSGLTVNGGTANINIASNQTPVLGTVTVS